MADKRKRRTSTTTTAAPTDTAMAVLEPQPPTSDPGAIALSADMREFFVDHPLMERRRVRLDAEGINRLIAEALMRRGMPQEKLENARWLWMNSPAGWPELCLILPGIEA